MRNRAFCIFACRLFGAGFDFVNHREFIFCLNKVACGLHCLYQVAELNKLEAAFVFVKIIADLCDVRIDTVAFFLEILKLSVIKIYFDLFMEPLTSQQCRSG